MSISEQQRHTVHQHLDQLMGPDVAATMMELLPPVGWGELATKHDLHQLEGRLTTRIDTAVTELRAEFRTELHTEIGALRDEFRSELHTEVGSLRDDLHTEVGSLRDDLHTEIGSLRSDLHSSLQSMTRTYVLANVGLVFTVAATAFGAAQLV